MKKISAFLITLSLLSSSAFAEDSTFSANAALTTDYVSRGISQSDGHPAVQGGLDWAHTPTGLYAGMWSSSVDLGRASAEVDLYAGITRTVDKLTWDLGALYYYYPGVNHAYHYDSMELAAALGYDLDFMLVNLSLNYSPDYFLSSGEAWYPAVNVNVPLPHDFSLDAGYGRQWFDENVAVGIADYNTWLLGVNYNIEGFILSLKYTDTSIGKTAICPDNCDARAFFMVSRTF